MKVAIVQSNYIPWRGYLDLIDDVDLFIYLDDVQYTRRDWRNRNKIKTANGLLWLSIPVKNESRSQLICETCINYSTGWNQNHLQQIHHWYKKAPYFNLYFNRLEELLTTRYQTISEINQALLSWIATELDIRTKVVCATKLISEGRNIDKLLCLLKSVGATRYVSGPSARAYIDHERFDQANILLEYKAYVYSAYPQLYGDFVGAVSVIDLLFNVGPQSRSYLKSKTHDSLLGTA